MFFFKKKNILDPNFLSQIVADVETRPYSEFQLQAIILGKVMRKTRWLEILIRFPIQFICDFAICDLRFCTTKTFFARRQYNFRQLPIASPLANPQNRLETSRTAISWRMLAGRRGAEKLQQIFWKSPIQPHTNICAEPDVTRSWPARIWGPRITVTSSIFTF
jgi:hypothetical protein